VLDAGCDTWRDTEGLKALGLGAAAIARACQKPEVRAAIEASGGSCPQQ
jgi:hypothetical protein